MSLRPMKILKQKKKKSHRDHSYTCKEILITGEEMFIDYIGQRLKEVFEVNSYEENDGLFMVMGIYRMR